jgi:hypothetical protein
MANASKYDLLKILRTRSDITVKTLSDLYAIKAYRRKWMVTVGVYDDATPANNGLYQLIKGTSSDDIKDNENWVKDETLEYTHPTGFSDKPAIPLDYLDVISQLTVSDEGHLLDTVVRELPHKNYGKKNITDPNSAAVYLNGLFEWASIGWAQITDKPTLYSKWILKAGTEDTGANIEDGNDVVFQQGTNITLSRSGRQITISSSVEIPQPELYDHNLTEHLDVIISTPGTGNLLRFDGSNWVNWSPNFLTSYTETDPVFASWRDTNRTQKHVFAAPNDQNGTPSWRRLTYTDIDNTPSIPTGFTISSDILSGGSNSVNLFTTDESANRRFYTNAAVPMGTSRLAVGAKFYATELYEGINRVLTSIPLSTSDVRGGLKIGFTASTTDLPLLLSSERGYIRLTSTAIQAALTGTITTHGHATLTRGVGLTGDNYNGTSSTQWNIDFAGSGTANTVARSDHSHDNDYDNYILWYLKVKTGEDVTVGAGHRIRYYEGGSTTISEGSEAGTTTLTISSVNNYVSGLSFSGGVITAARVGLASLDLNIDGRYSLIGHTHSYDNYVSWVLKANTEGTGVAITSGVTVDIVGSGATSVSRNGSIVTISSLNNTYSGSTSIILSGTSFQRAALTGDVTATQNSNATTIATNAVSNTKFRQSVGMSVVGRSASTTGDVSDITAATDGHILRRSGTSIGFGQIAGAGITNGTITYDKLQNITSQRILGRYSTTAGVIQEITIGTGLSLNTSTGALTNTALSKWTQSVNDIYNANSGNVGIGKSPVGAKLNVYGDIKQENTANTGIIDMYGGSIRVQSSSTTAANSSLVTMHRTRGTASSPSYISAGDIISVVRTTGRLQIQGDVTFSEIITECAAAGDDNGSSIHFRNRCDPGNLETIMTLGWLGLVGIKTTNPNRVLDVNGNLGVRGLLDKSSDANYTRVLVSDSLGNIDYVLKSGLGGSGISGLTTDFLPVATSSSSLGNSALRHIQYESFFNFLETSRPLLIGGGSHVYNYSEIKGINVLTTSISSGNLVFSAERRYNNISVELFSVSATGQMRLPLLSSATLSTHANVLIYNASGGGVGYIAASELGGGGSYDLPLAANGTRGGIQIGYSANGANLPLVLSSEKAYIALTKSAVESVINGVQALSGTTSRTWNVSTARDATMTIGANTTITLSNLVAGMSGSLRVTCASTSYTITFSGYTFKISPFVYFESGKVKTTAQGGALDIFSFWYDGSTVYINGTNDYK